MNLGSFGIGIVSQYPPMSSILLYFSPSLALSYIVEEGLMIDDCV